VLFGDPIPRLEAPFYFSEARVSSSATELRVDLLSQEADGAVVGLRVFLSPDFARKIHGVLERNVAQYEKRFGHVRVARGPAALGTPTRVVSSLLVNWVRVTSTQESFFLQLETWMPAPNKLKPAFRAKAITAPAVVPVVMSALDAELLAFAKAKGF
jgi:hypothetical protein